MPISNLLVVDLLLGGVGIYILKALLSPKKTPAPLPPGPKPVPIVGNIADLPPAGVQEWVHWGKHKELYGPISSITVLGTTIIVINDARIAFELFEKRSSTYSDRPPMIFAGEMCGWEDALSSQMYRDRFRAYRKNIHAILGSKTAVSKFYDLQETEIRRFALRVLESPDDLLQHIRTEAGAIILKIAYGYTIEPKTADPLVDLADEALVQFSLAANPGAWLVDMMPFLRHLPDWFPGSGFKRTAARWNKCLQQTAGQPYEFVKKQMAEGTAAPSYVQALLEKGVENMTAEEQFVAKWSAASLYTGGADTTVSSIACFYLAMALYPDVQREAQAELDRVVGPDRLPTFADRAQLPYLDALLKEVLRWHPVAPMGLPHVTTEDDTFEGHFIPKGAMLMPNIWGFMHDPTVYSNPLAFNPSRFLGPTPEPDTHTLAFGFGRRICPGRELADASVFLSLATSLAAFEIADARDVQGKALEAPICVAERFKPGVISHPEPFRVAVRARNAKAAALVRSVEEDHPFTQSDSKELSALSY